jgi:hypothetical protein
MKRALNLDMLTSALGTHERLPSPSELQVLLARAEIGLFTRQLEVDEALLDAAWYLQSIATSRSDLQLFDTARKRQAHQVSAHIFDLILQTDMLSQRARLRYTFASQVGYLGGELTPNAAAMARRAPLPLAPFEWTDPGVVSLEAGILLLALNRAQIYPLLKARRDQLSLLAQQVGDLGETVYAAVNGVILGVWNIINFLTYGRQDALANGRQWLQRSLETESAAGDVDSRWVAAHLLEIGGSLGSSSVWSVLPPNLPSVARAMTLGDPPVLLLWPPQLSFLEPETGGDSPLDPNVRRLVLSFPTSAGKSLLAQLFVTSHVVAGAGDVCVVAPTHSLCRELAASLERRLRTLGHQLYEDGPLGLFEAKPPTARVVVMTPEKLAAHLRNNPAELLEEFGLFVVDEAHLVADGERGWRLEETISFLHHLTRDTEHRLLVLSAALGSQVHVVAWINSGSGVISKHDSWRGPRRLNVVFTTEPDWQGERIEPADGTRQPRRHVPLKGVLALKASAGDTDWVRGEFTEPVGTLVRQRRRDGSWTRDAKQSTRQRAQLVPLVGHVIPSGPVLVVEATRTEAQRLAEEIADHFDEDATSPLGLVDTIRSRLGADHPLAKVLAKRIAFHHSALPVDIQAEIEDAVRSGTIRCLVATTTLTEGVNLPFKTVIIAHRGYQGAEGEVQLIDAARLMNAIGRAGRAGRETEGWLILVQYRQFETAMFEELERSGREIELRSTLAGEAAIEALAGVEAATMAGEDLILSNHAAIADGFISYVWFVADALLELRGSLSPQAVHEAVKDTLAWQQLSDDSRNQLLRVATLALESFLSQPAERRGRWARAGTSIPSAAILDAVAEQVAGAFQAAPQPATLSDALGLILANDRLRALLDLAENKSRGFKRRRNDPRDNLIDVNMDGLVAGWTLGTGVQELADEYLGVIEDADYRYSQLAEFSASVFEHHLPWALGIVIAWANRALQTQGSATHLPEELPGAVHFGVGTPDALELMLGGVRSRRLANRVSEVRVDETGASDAQTLREWLSVRGIGAWRVDFAASPTEVLDLLAFVRAPGARLVNEVLEGNGYTIRFEPRGSVAQGAEATLQPEPNQPEPAPLVVVVDGEIVGNISPEHQEDITLLTDIGIPLTVHAESDSADVWRLLLRLAPELDT